MAADEPQSILQPAGDSPRPGVSKAVTISEEPAHIATPPLEYAGNGDPPLPAGSHSPMRHRASISGKKMTGRPQLNRSTSSLTGTHQVSNLALEHAQEGQTAGDEQAPDTQTLLTQVFSWLHEEKSKRAGRNAADPAPGNQADGVSPLISPEDLRTPKQDAMALEKLETILSNFAASSKHAMPRLGHKTSTLALRKGSIARKMKKSMTAQAASSDTEAQDSELLVPNVEASLDNSKTMAFTGGSADAEISTKAQRKDKEHWVAFKQDVIRLTHTLRLKGWRRLPIESGADIEVERLSGALTNAVYVVSPPKKMPESEVNDDSAAPQPQKPPMKLLLRVYGPQAGHLIDREEELLILRRLARKRIGPRLLGTFTNGRFEEFFNARTLTPEDLREPETSKQIAKRMRELHDGIDLLESELDDGPRVFGNWNQWVGRCEQIITWLDKQVKQKETKEDSHRPSRYTKRGLICGVEWPRFRETVERYHRHLLDVYGGKLGLRNHLVFAHNDTQYGNLMRLNPSGESPLIKPVNEHKQLIVIDFEYASPNTPGLEFANHFTEWCYNYHQKDREWACNTKAYPSQEEQKRFIRSYVQHRPQFNPTASATPKMEGREKTKIPDFMLDARTPAAATAIDYSAEEQARVEKVEKDIQHLMNDTRLWRVANSAQWVAWGIVQAKVPELDEKPKSKTAAVLDRIRGKFYPLSDPLTPEVQALAEDAKHDRPESRDQEEAHEEGDAEEDDEFDYLAYAQERAMFFWGDCLSMGFVKKEDLPEDMLRKVKIVEY